MFDTLPLYPYPVKYIVAIHRMNGGLLKSIHRGTIHVRMETRYDAHVNIIPTMTVILSVLLRLDLAS
jgi:hypothetical protein